MQIVLVSTFGYISGRYMLNICLHADKMEANGIHMIKLYLTKYLMRSLKAAASLKVLFNSKQVLP